GRHLLVGLAVALLLVACSDAPPPALLPQPGVRATFPPGGITNLIRIEALDARALRSAELVAPDGAVTEATYLNVVKTPEAATGQLTLNDPWRSSMLGTNGIPQIPSASLAAAPRSTSQLLLMASAAEIPVPDPVAY